MRIVECEELAAGKSVRIGDIIFVGTKGEYENKELETIGEIAV
ncbi:MULTISPECIES: hypothetical protein [Bacillaceae]|nr:MULTISPECIES: hypothetical protein [Bacillaceae]